jgi:20S proteasome alpha/beta subunit
MTVCIGAICEDGKSAVVAADKMVTFGPPMNLQTEPPAFEKIKKLTPTCLVAFSGSVPDGEEIVARSQTRLGAAPKQPVAQIADHVKDAYIELKKKRAEETILRPLLGADFPQFQMMVTQSSSSQILQQVVGMMMQHNLQLDVLVVGADQMGCHLFVATHPGVLMPLGTTGFTAIGTGGLHAAVRLSLGQHTRIAPLLETIYNVYEAKKASEVAPGVGKLMDMALIREGTVHLASPQAIDAVEKLRSSHQEKPALTQTEKEGIKNAFHECLGKAGNKS